MDQYIVSMLFIFIPGIIGLSLFRNLTSPFNFTPFYFIIHTFVFGVVSYLLVYIISDILVCKQIFFIDYKKLFSSQAYELLKVDSIVVTVFASIIIALFLSYIDNRKLLFRIAAKFKISTRSGEKDLLTNVLNSRNIYWVYVRDFENCLTYFGIIDHFSESGNKKELYLRDVEVYDLDKKKMLYAVNGVYLFLENMKFSIEVPKQGGVYE